MIYSIDDDMRKNLCEFCGGYASESKTAECIKNVYDNTGYVIDTHTAVAASVYEDYRKKTGDTTPSVIAILQQARISLQERNGCYRLFL